MTEEQQQEEIQDAPTTVEVTLGGVTATLELPQNYAVRWDVYEAVDVPPHRQVAAALGVCWPAGAKWPGNGNVPKYNLTRFNVGLYGGHVIQSLAIAGFSRGQVAAAGIPALGLIRRAVYGAEEVRRSEDFSGSEEEPTD